MQIVTIHTAKTTLSQLLARVEAGEEIVPARGRKPIAKLVPFCQPRRGRRSMSPARAIRRANSSGMRSVISIGLKVSPALGPGSKPGGELCRYLLAF
jgi:antitoxin (DNA-binding transcriptional repressor) of toxin-antitoxin stability system